MIDWVIGGIAVLASALAVWSRFRQRQLLRRVLRSLDETQRRELEKILEQKQATRRD